MGGIAFLTIILVSSLIKFSTNNQQASMDDVFNVDMLNAYFSGIGNVALGVDAYYEKYDGNNIEYLTSDIFQNVPKISKVIDQKYRTTKIFNYQYYNSPVGKSQIVPIQVSGLFHYGYFFSAAYSFLFVFLSFYFERLSKKSLFIGSTYVFLFLSLNCSLFMMLNLGSVVSNVFTHIILTLLLFLFLQRGVFLFNKRL